MFVDPNIKRKRGKHAVKGSTKDKSANVFDT